MPELDNPAILCSVLDGLHLAVCVLDRDGKITLWNQEAAHATGYMQHEVIGRCYQDVILCHPEDQALNEHPTVCPFTRLVHEGKPALLKTQLRHKRGYSVPVLIHISPIRNQHGFVVATVASFDVQGSRAQGQHQGRNLPPLAALDSGTGVANHSFTSFHLRESLTAFTDYHVPFGILRVKPVGLERFRAAYGREASEAILLVVAQALGDNFRPSDFVGRWATDEFLVILKNCAKAGVESVYERIHAGIASAEIRWWGELLSVPLSFGYASVELGDTVDMLLHRAECPELTTTATAGAAGSPQHRR